MTETTESQPVRRLPIRPLRDVVVYPHMVIPLFVGREKSIQALDVAMRTDKRIMLVAQKQADVDDPKADDLYRIIRDLDPLGEHAHLAWQVGEAEAEAGDETDHAIPLRRIGRRMDV